MYTTQEVLLMRKREKRSLTPDANGLFMLYNIVYKCIEVTTGTGTF